MLAGNVNGWWVVVEQSYRVRRADPNFIDRFSIQHTPAQATESNPNPNEGILDFSLHYENVKHIL